MGREPGAGLMRVLEGRAEALAGTFNVQGMANTLWAYATMGREPGAGLMRVLEGRAEVLAGTFNTQEVANTLWAASVLSFFAPQRKEVDGCKRLRSDWCPLASLRASLPPTCASSISSLCGAARLGVEAINDMQSLKETCRSAFVGAPHGAVGEGRGSLPKVGVFHRHAAP